MTVRLAAPSTAVAVVLLISLAASTGAEPPTASAAPLTFHCTLDAACPEVLVAGDPYATIGANPSPFRGYGDPSLERDPVTGTVWLAYSWLDVLVTNPGPSQLIDFGVETHLARSDNGGASFAFVEPVNQMTAVTHPGTSASGWESHEVSTLVREGSNNWQMMWLTYFDPPGSAPFFDVRYERALGSSPDALGAPVEWARGNGTSSAWGSQHNLSTIPQLADCAAFTEPALFQHDGVTYLATNCVVFSGGVRQDAQERLVLLRQEAVGYSFVGNLLDGQDAIDAGGTRIEQADIALSQSGEVLLIATPIQSAAPNHLGCVVFEITDITTASVLRDGAGAAVPLASVTGDDSSIGPGLCTYDAASDTGVLMVLHIFSPSPFDLEFSMRATGIHPMDTDRDGIENTQDQDDDGDTVSDASDNCVLAQNIGQENSDGDPQGNACDNCPTTSNAAQTNTDGDGAGDACDPDDDNDGFSDSIETTCGSNTLLASSRVEWVSGAFSATDDDGDTLIDEALPGAASSTDCDGDGFTGVVELAVYASVQGDQAPCGTTPNTFPFNVPVGWPADLKGSVVSDHKITLQDVTSFVAPVRYFNSNIGASPGDQRWDIVPGSNGMVFEINLQDITRLVTLYPPMLNGARAFNGPVCPWP